MTTPHEAVTAALHGQLLARRQLNEEQAEQAATAAIEALRSGAYDRVLSMVVQHNNAKTQPRIADYVTAILGPPNEVPE